MFRKLAIKMISMELHLPVIFGNVLIIWVHFVKTWHFFRLLKLLWLGKEQPSHIVAYSRVRLHIQEQVCMYSFCSSLYLVTLQALMWFSLDHSALFIPYMLFISKIIFQKNSCGGFICHKKGFILFDLQNYPNCTI